MKVDLLGVPIDFVDHASVIERILDAARKRQFLQVATVNLDFLVNSRRDREVAEILRCTTINIADGAPVVWAGRALGCADAGRLAGSDLVPALLSVAAREQLRVFFLGGENGSAEEAARKLRTELPRLDVVTMEPPRVSLEEMTDDAIFEALRAAQPHILLVALGHPKQDKWIHRHRRQLPMAAIGVGCTLDLLAGRRSRAPHWVQRAGLEWGYRLIHEPRRLGRRYAGDGLWAAFTLLPWVILKRLGWSG